MKWVFYVLVLVYMFYRAVFGARVDTGSISVDQIDYGKVNYLEVGSRTTINCKLSNRNRMVNKLEWIDPNGNVISRTPSRVFSKENVVSNAKGARFTGLVLNLQYLSVNDTGLYTCRYGKQSKDVPVCVLKPTEFTNSNTEVLVESGRSITLHCKVTGSPEPMLAWHRNGNEIADDDKYRVNKIFNVEGYESLLTIISVGPDDDGVYSCHASQDISTVDNCSHFDSLNVTLLVSQAPWFENNVTVNVYSKEDEEAELKCEARGWPKPTYRFFAIGEKSLVEFDTNKIKLSEDQRVASVHVPAGRNNYELTYKCRATNNFGESDQYFKLLETTEPLKAISVSSTFATESEIAFNVIWPDEVPFPVDNIEIQYIQSSLVPLKKPREYDWRKGSLTQMEMDRDKDVITDEGLIVKIENLEPDTEYWVRLRAVNDVGEAPWSDPVQASTIEADALTATFTVTESAEPEQPEKEVSDTRMFYGIFFAGAIAITVAVCMFAMRIV